MVVANWKEPISVGEEALDNQRSDESTKVYTKALQVFRHGMVPNSVSAKKRSRSPHNNTLSCAAETRKEQE